MKIFLAFFVCLFLLSCNKNESEENKADWQKENPKELPSFPYAMNSPSVLIKNARIMTAAGSIYEKGFLLMERGLIKKVSREEIKVNPETTQVLDAAGMTVTPGIIDVHSHMGVYPSPSVDAHSDGNEATRPVTPDVWAEHSFWPQDPDIWRALAGGITTIQVLPGSANLIGGRSFTAKLIPQLSAREMRFHSAPQGLKMACGENPKRVYNKKSISTRMGNLAGYRKAYQEALEYRRKLENYNKEKKGDLPKRDLVSETLVKVLEGKILVHFHCYRADDISAVLDLAQEFGFKIRTIHHGLEAYKVAGRLAKEDVSVATWADWWGFKAEAFDGIPHNVALLHKAGGRPIIHSDSAVDIRYLPLEAGKALAAAKSIGLNFSEDEALAWVTKNPAWALGIDDKVGTLEEGKMADLVLWDGHPFSVYSKAQKVFINGNLAFDRRSQKRPRSDFEVGFNDKAFYDGRDFVAPPLVQNIQWAQHREQPASVPSKTFTIVGVKVFDGAQWKDNVQVKVRDGLIDSISSRPAKEGETIYSGQGQTLTPGWVEVPSLLGLYEVSLDSKAQDLYGDFSQMTPDYRAADSLNKRNIRVPIFRKEGVTFSVVQANGGPASGYGVGFELDPDNGKTVKDIAFFGSMKKRGKGKNRSAQWSALRELIEDTVSYMKNKKDYAEGDMRPLSLSYNHLKAMEKVLLGKVPWVMEVFRADDIRKWVHIQKDLKKKGYPVKFMVSGGAEAWKVTQELKEESIPVILTPSKQTPQSFNQSRARFDLAAYLHDKGVTVILNDSNDLGTTRTRQEAGFAVKYGLSHDQALQSITQTPAKLFGLEQGTLRPGRPATMVLWSADPLEPTSQAQALWIGGRSMSLENRQTELAKKYLNSN